MPTIIFETSRMLARRIESTDLDAMCAVYGDEAAMRWVGDGKALDRARCEQWIVVTHRNYATRGYGMFALVERQSGAVLGFCGLVHPGGQAEAEIKYALRREHWGKGLATEAAAAMLAYAFSGPGLQLVIATAAPAHTTSHRVLLKAGMHAAGDRHNDDGSITRMFEWRAGADARVS